MKRPNLLKEKGLMMLALLLLSHSHSFSVRRATGASLSSRVNAFYRDHGCAVVTKPSDSLLVVHERESDRIAGAARLVTQHEGVQFLRGVFVSPAWRRRGVGTMLARAATEHSEQASRPCFTCVFDELSPLYARAGFAALDEFAFPSRQFFDSVSPSAGGVNLELIYLTPSLRISRELVNDVLFVHTKV